MGAKTLTFFTIMFYNSSRYWLAVQPGLLS